MRNILVFNPSCLALAWRTWRIPSQCNRPRLSYLPARVTSQPQASVLRPRYDPLRAFSAFREHGLSPPRALAFPSGLRTRLGPLTTIEFTAVWPYHLRYKAKVTIDQPRQRTKVER